MSQSPQGHQWHCPHVPQPQRTSVTPLPCPSAPRDTNDCSHVPAPVSLSPTSLPPNPAHLYKPFPFQVDVAPEHFFRTQINLFSMKIGRNEPTNWLRHSLGWSFIKIGWKSLGLSCCRLGFGQTPSPEPLLIIYRARDFQHHPITAGNVSSSHWDRQDLFLHKDLGQILYKRNWFLKMVQISWAHTHWGVTFYYLIFNNCLRHWFLIMKQG